MPSDPQTLETLVDQILRTIQVPFWHRPEFWIASVIGLAGLYYSYQAFVEAGQAKAAATAAGRTVKLQTVIIELMEVSQRLFQIDHEMLFDEARNSLAVISSKVRRAVTPFAEDSRLSGAIKATLESIETAQESLQAVCPADPAKEKEAPFAVYNAIQAHFLTISNDVAGLIGLFEKETLDLGEK